MTRSLPSPALAGLHRPVGIFDAGIGSYDLVRRIQAAYPRQDVIYLADRASFPYGAKSEDELLASVARAARALASLGTASIILASNAPSVTVLDALHAEVSVPVQGVLPPVGAALRSLPPDRTLVVAGANVLVRSVALTRLIAEAAGSESGRVHVQAADELIALVESGAFLRRESIERPVADFISRLREQHPRLGGISLSSTHLPWLAPVIREIAPALPLFDPADAVVAAFRPLADQALEGSGRLVCLATASAEHPLAEFEAMLQRLHIDVTPTLIEL